MLHRQLSILAIEHPLEKRALAALASILCLLVLAYLYLVAASVMNIVARKEADARATQIQSSIGALEESYFALSNALTPDSASSLGLAPVAKTAYVYRPGNAAAASVSSSLAAI